MTTEYNIPQILKDHQAEIFPEENSQLKIGSGLMTPPPRPASIRDKDDRMSFFKGEQGISAKSDQSFNFVMNIVNALTSKKKYAGIPDAPVSIPSPRPKDFKAPDMLPSRPTTGRFKRLPFDKLMGQHESFRALNPEPSDAIYQGVKNQFKDVKVSEMTIKEVLNFTKLNGEYGNAVQEQRGGRAKDFATPVGKYQLTGTLIREIIRDSDLFTEEDLSTLKFDTETQDKMFDWKVNDLTKNKTTSKEILAVLKNTWVGLNNAEDYEILSAFKEWKEAYKQ
tara:strand:- start:1196 stop:2035 length:840 start_codon:yes stop_codon:yes gene_type:complete